MLASFDFFLPVWYTKVMTYSKASSKAWYEKNKTRLLAAQKLYYQGHKDATLMRVAARYLLKREQVLEYSRAYYKANKPKFRASAIKSRKKLRMEVLTHYGGKCACCSECSPEFLAIDHVNGGGNAHRRLLTGRSTGPSTLVYAWLRRNGFPEGFRVLCHNCNLARGFYGYCPHEGPT